MISGNVDDQVCWDGGFLPLRRALGQFLAVTGFRAVAHYDLADGLTYPDDESREIVRRRLATMSPARQEPGPQPQPAAQSGAAPDGGRPAGQSADGRNSAQSRLSGSAATLQRRMAAARTGEVRTPADLVAAARHLMCQAEDACALVLHAAELLFSASLPVGDGNQSTLMYLSKAIEDATYAPAREGTLRNCLVLVTRQPSALPEWLQRHNPHLAAVSVELPGQAERLALIEQELRNFDQARSLTNADVGQAVPLLANLTQGMTSLDIRALAATSRTTRIPPTSAKRLIMRHRFGLQEDPWEKLDPGKIVNAERSLSTRVMGQPAAVRAAADMLVNAKIGIDFVSDSDAASTRPKGVFFFVGPTGVGKTELAKAIAELVFDDETAMRRFDMSEFGQEHTSERLTGAPPGYVGHESGGVLTNWVIDRPFSVILFDEIEKAHPKIFDKFLQIIDDGRLTDGHGRTAYFSQSVVIFTSNLGAATLRQAMAAQPEDAADYAFVRDHFMREVTTYFTQKIGRPELLGRLGSGIVAFDVLREPIIAQIVGKFLDQLAAAARTRGYTVEFDRSAIESAVAAQVSRDGAQYGARQIRTPLLEEWVRIPLNRWIMENTPPPGANIRVHKADRIPPFAICAR